MKNLVLLILIFICSSADAQHILHGNELNDRERLKNTQVVGGRIERPDTILDVLHSPIVIMPKRVFLTDRERKYYQRLIYNIKKVYPYSIEIRNVYAQIIDSIGKLSTEQAKKDYLEKTETMLFEKYKKPLVALTITQGRLLIKLVKRETGNTTYKVIQDLKGNGSAFLWQAVGLLFGTSLKAEYDPVEEDKMIEEIIHMIENGQL